MVGPGRRGRDAGRTAEDDDNGLLGLAVVVLREHLVLGDGRAGDGRGGRGAPRDPGLPEGLVEALRRVAARRRRRHPALKSRRVAVLLGRLGLGLFVSSWLWWIFAGGRWEERDDAFEWKNAKDDRGRKWFDWLGEMEAGSGNCTLATRF